MKRQGSTGALRKRFALLQRRAKEGAQQVGPNPHREGGTKKFVVLGLVGCALCGPVALMTGSGGSSAAGAAPVTASVDPAVPLGEQARAANVAEAFLRQWLVASQATGEQISRELLSAPSTLSFPQHAPAAPSSITLADVANPSPGIWLISFSVTGGASGPGATYQVPVKVEGMQAGVITLPSRVGEAAAPSKMTSSATSISMTSPAAQAAVGFIKSWLTNAGDITRWTTSDFTPAPVTTQLCQQVVLRDVKASHDDEMALAVVAPQPDASSSATPEATPSPSVATGTVTATVTCTTAATTQLLTYRLALTSVAGQLVVSAVNPYTA